jgi:recombination protein RecA
MAPPFREAEFEIRFGKGIYRISEILDTAIDLDLVSKSGSWLSFGDDQMGQGREKSLTYLEEHPAMVDTLMNKIRGDEDAKPAQQKQKTQAA